MDSISAFISTPNLFFLNSKVYSKKTLHEILRSHKQCKKVALCGMNMSFQNSPDFLSVISYGKMDLGNKEKEEEEMLMKN